MSAQAVPLKTAGGDSAARFSGRFFERFATDELVRIRTKLSEVLDDRARQFDLFQPPPGAPEPTAPDADDMAEFGAVLSPTQVDCWLDCQARWLFRYFRRLPERVSASLAFGRAIHRALARNFEAKALSQRDLDPEEVVTLFREVWGFEAETALFRPNQDRAEYERQGCTLVRLYLERIAPAIQPAVIDRRPAVEWPVSGAIAGIPARGFIDLIDVEGRLIDLKSSSRTNKELRPSHRAQLAAYRLLGPACLTGACRVDQIVRKSAPDIVALEYCVTDADERFLQTIYPLAQASMRAGLYLPNRSSLYCSRSQCAYWRECMEEFGGDVPV